MDEKVETIGELVEIARGLYFNAKRDKIDPVSRAWTEKAKEFTIPIRTRIFYKDPDALKLKYLLLYFHRLNRMLRFRADKKKKKEFLKEQQLAIRMRQIALSGRYKGQPAPDLDLKEINSVIFQG